MVITNEDNMELMSRYEDNYFDLAIVDPPYGIDIHKMNYTQTNSALLDIDVVYHIVKPNKNEFCGTYAG